MAAMSKTHVKWSDGEYIHFLWVGVHLLWTRHSAIPSGAMYAMLPKKNKECFPVCSSMAKLYAVAKMLWTFPSNYPCSRLPAEAGRSDDSAETKQARLSSQETLNKPQAPRNKYGLPYIKLSWNTAVSHSYSLKQIRS